MFGSLCRENGLLEIRVRRRDHMKTRTAKPSASPSLVMAKRNRRDYMEFHRVLGHPSREITRETARMAGLQSSGAWSPCIHFSESRVRRYTLPKFIESRAERCTERIFIDISGLFHEIPFGGNIFIMMCVDDCTRFKFIRFLRHKSDATEALRRIIDEDTTPADLKVDIIHTDGGGKFDGQFQSLLTENQARVHSSVYTLI